MDCWYFFQPCCRAWAGKSSDISYYLNSHHIDIHNWSVQSFAQPVRVTAMASRGVADEKLGEVCRGRAFQFTKRAPKFLIAAAHLGMPLLHLHNPLENISTCQSGRLCEDTISRWHA